MGLLIGGRLDDEEETGDVGYVCRYLLPAWRGGRHFPEAGCLPLLRNH